MLKYKPDELQKALLRTSSYEVIHTLQKYNVNPKTIREIAVIDSLSVLKISDRYYYVSGFSSGYNGAGPGVLTELLEWCGCNNEAIFNEIKTQRRVHFQKDPDINKWKIL